MSASKRHLYRPVGDARDLRNVSSTGEFLRQGKQFAEVGEIPSPSRDGQSSATSAPIHQGLDHELSPSPAEPSPGPSLLLDDLLVPRTTVPRQHTSPVRNRPSEALTPSDEEELPGHTHHLIHSNGRRSLASAGLHTTKSAVPTEATGVDASVCNDMVVVEALDSAIGSGEVPLTSSVTRSPVKVVRHDVDGLGALPVSQGKQTPLGEVVPTQPNSGITEAGKGTSLTRKPSSKSKGRYVPSRYMQAPSSSKPANVTSKATVVSSKVSSSAARPGVALAKPPHPTATAASTGARRKPVKALASHVSQPVAGTSQRMSRPGHSTTARTSGTMAYKTPSQLPAEQALLRARQAMADSIFTPSLQPPSYTTGSVETLSHPLPAATGQAAVAQTPTMSKSSVSRPASGQRPGSGNRGAAAAALPASVPGQRPGSGTRGTAAAPSTGSSGQRPASATRGGGSAPLVGASTAPAASHSSQSNPHRLTACYARSMQWAFLDAKVEHNLKMQERFAEQQIHAMWREVESLQRQEVEYVEKLASLQNAKLVDEIVYSQLSSLRSVAGSLDKLGDSHSSLASALTTVYHQLPVKGFVLPENIGDLTHSLEGTEELLQSVSHSLAEPAKSELPRVAHLLDALSDSVEDELRELKESKLLMQKACRLQTALTSMSIHSVQLESEE